MIIVITFTIIILGVMMMMIITILTMMMMQRLRVSSETARELSDRTAACLSLGEGDTVVRLIIRSMMMMINSMMIMMIMYGLCALMLMAYRLRSWGGHCGKMTIR